MSEPTLITDDIERADAKKRWRESGQTIKFLSAIESLKEQKVTQAMQGAAGTLDDVTLRRLLIETRTLNNILTYARSTDISAKLT